MPERVYLNADWEGKPEKSFGTVEYIRADKVAYLFKEGAPKGYVSTPTPEPPLSVEERMAWEMFVGAEITNPENTYKTNFQRAQEATKAFLSYRKG